MANGILSLAPEMVPSAALSGAPVCDDLSMAMKDVAFLVRTLDP